MGKVLDQLVSSHDPVSSFTSMCGDFLSLSTNQNLAYLCIDIISDLC